MKPIQKEDAPATEDIAALRAWLDTQYREYMHAAQVSSTLSPKVLRRYQPIREYSKLRLFKVEKEVLHKLVAVSYLYQSQAIGCALGEAHFAAGIMVTSAIECMMIVIFIQLKSATKRTKTFKEQLQKRAIRTSARKARSPQSNFIETLLSMRLPDTFKIAQELKLFSDTQCSAAVTTVLKHRGFNQSGGLISFILQARNSIHTKQAHLTIDKYSKWLDVYYHPNLMFSYHADFTLCAWDLHGQLVEGFNAAAQAAGL